MPNESTDDLHTYGAVPVTVVSHGCAGEFCPGPNSPHPCAACRDNVRRTDVCYRPLQSHIW